MRELIKSNKRKSFLLIVLFFLVIMALGFFISYFSDDQGLFLIIAFIYGIISILGGYFAGDKMVLASVGAKEVKKEDDPDLYNTVENLAITAGIPMPRVYRIADQSLNAFATGRNPEHASVAITDGLRQKLSKAELEAVMGHELSHITNYDIRTMLLTAVLVGMVIFLSDILWRIALGGGKSDNKKGAGGIFVIVALILGLIAAPIAAQLIKLAISRRREYLADAGSALLTRYPEAMVSALQKIASDPTVEGHHDSIAHLFIYPPNQKVSWRQRLFSTHPPIQDRIAALQNAARIR